MKIWKTLSTEVISQNPYWKHKRDTFEIPGKTQGIYEYVETPGAVVIIAIDDEGKLLCLKQYRYLAEKMSLEFPGGGIKQGQDPENAARAELGEEARREAGKLIHVASFHPLLGVVKEVVHVFIATQLIKTEEYHLDATEEFEDVRLTPDEWEQAIQSGEAINGFVLGAWAVARPHVLRIVDEIRRNQ